MNEFIIPSKSQALALGLEWRQEATLNQKVEKLIKSLKTRSSEEVPENIVSISCICGHPALQHARHNWGQKHTLLMKQNKPQEQKEKEQDNASLQAST